LDPTHHPHFLFLFVPNDEICKGMFDLLNTSPLDLFFYAAYRSAPRKKEEIKGQPNEFL
jgi:hypothetical protein